MEIGIESNERNPRRWYRRSYGFDPVYGVSDMRFWGRLNAREFEQLRGRGCVPPPPFEFAQHPLWNPRSDDLKLWFKLLAIHRDGKGVSAFDPPREWQDRPPPERLIPITVLGAAAGFDGRNLYKAFDLRKVPPPEYVYGSILLYRNTPLLEGWVEMAYKTKGRRDRIASLPLWNDYVKASYETGKTEFSDDRTGSN